MTGRNRTVLRLSAIAVAVLISLAALAGCSGSKSGEISKASVKELLDRKWVNYPDPDHERVYTVSKGEDGKFDVLYNGIVYSNGRIIETEAGDTLLTMVGVGNFYWDENAVLRYASADLDLTDDERVKRYFEDEDHINSFDDEDCVGLAYYYDGLLFLIGINEWGEVCLRECYRDESADLRSATLDSLAGTWIGNEGYLELKADKTFSFVYYNNLYTGKYEIDNASEKQIRFIYDVEDDDEGYAIDDEMYLLKDNVLFYVEEGPEYYGWFIKADAVKAG